MGHYYDDINRLMRAGYNVAEKSPWHYQVEQNGVTCNVWPSKQKYMVEFGNGASIYDDVVEAVRSIVGAPGVKETRAERHARIKAYLDELYPIPVETPELKAWRYELTVLVNYVNRLTAKRKAEQEAMDF